MSKYMANMSKYEVSKWIANKSKYEMSKYVWQIFAVQMYGKYEVSKWRANTGKYEMSKWMENTSKYEMSKYMADICSPNIWQIWGVQMNDKYEQIWDVQIYGLPMFNLLFIPSSSPYFFHLSPLLCMFMRFIFEHQIWTKKQNTWTKNQIY